MRILLSAAHQLPGPAAPNVCEAGSQLPRPRTEGPWGRHALGAITPCCRWGLCGHNPGRGYFQRWFLPALGHHLVPSRAGSRGVSHGCARPTSQDPGTSAPTGPASYLIGSPCAESGRAQPSPSPWQPQPNSLETT